MLVRAQTQFKVGRWCAEAGRHYDIPERAAYVVEYGWAVEIPEGTTIEGEIIVIDRDMISADAPLPPQDGATLEVQSVTHTGTTTVEGQ